MRVVLSFWNVCSQSSFHVYLFDAGGASHFNNRIAFFKISLYTALGEHESKEFIAVDA